MSSFDRYCNAPAVVCPVAFGPTGLDQFRLWYAVYAQSGSTLPVAILTDEAPAPRSPWCGEHLMVPFSGRHPDHATSTNMRKAGSIKIQGREALQAMGIHKPIIAMDTDIIVQRPLDPLVHICAGYDMALGPNAWSTPYSEWPEVVDELNTGLIWINSPLVAKIWHTLWPYAYDKYQFIRDIPYSDEIVQTVILRRLQGLVLDRKWNLSHRLEAEYGEATCIHYHGPNKDKFAAHAKRIIEEAKP